MWDEARKPLKRSREFADIPEDGPASRRPLSPGPQGDWRRVFLTDKQLELLLPTEGYVVLEPPAGYLDQRNAAKPDLDARLRVAEAITEDMIYAMLDADVSTFGEVTPGEGLTEALGDAVTEVTLRASDLQYFGRKFDIRDQGDLTAEQATRREIALLLLKLKSGTPQVRRAAMRELTSRATEFGPGPLFDELLPLMMQSTLEGQETHILVKVIDRILYKLDDRVRPFAHSVLVVIEPLLIDENPVARIEGREILSNLAKAVGLATMIAVMRPDIDHPDEVVRNTTARAFAVVGAALGIHKLLLFLKAVCVSKSSDLARHTGMRIIQQIAILTGCAVLPHLVHLVDIVAAGLHDAVPRVKSMAAHAIAALAEASHPYGIEAFEVTIAPLWRGVREFRDYNLSAVLKAVGRLIPLMDSEAAEYYSELTIRTISKQFGTQNDQMRDAVLLVLRLVVTCEGVTSSFVQGSVMKPFFRELWCATSASDPRVRNQVVGVAVALGKKVGTSAVLGSVIPSMFETGESFRCMALLATRDLISVTDSTTLRDSTISSLFDGLMFTFQEATDETKGLIKDIGAILSALGSRVSPYLDKVRTIVQSFLNTPSARVRQQAAELLAVVAPLMQECQQVRSLHISHLGLTEAIDKEEYPDVLAAILSAITSIVSVVDMESLNPGARDLVPRLTPILRNRNTNVQEQAIRLVGKLAERAGDQATPKEWDRMSFDMIELLRAPKKSIRTSTIHAFGYIARTIGPHDVMSTLLSNLRVQERQLRLCTTIAISIVAETCMPYTVMPALMNEYTAPDRNVQNGCLKALSFMFEYIGELSKDYIYSVVPLLEDALMERDVVHRQTAAWACKHLALGVAGLGYEKCLRHLLNYILPNIFDPTPHLQQAVFDAIDAIRIALGPGELLLYLQSGLFHPARRVREVYWRLYNNLYIGNQDALVAFHPVIKLEALDCNIPQEFQQAARNEEDQGRGIDELMWLI